MSKAVALFSGGLDSMLAARLVMEQGVEVVALQFITPFFNYKHKGREEEDAREFKEKYGFDCIIVDVTDEYVEMVRNPRYGYGKNFNPCIDCKIFMMKKAALMMKDIGADFIVSGEVLGQRPMSQRKDALRIVERDSGLDRYLLRPLCAKLMNTTYPEEQGMVDREKLLDISGRARNRQMELAGKFGIKDYQTPAGGCLLTDPIISKRVESLLKSSGSVTPDDLTLLSTGRHFGLPGGKLHVGRNKDENAALAGLARHGDYTLKTTDRPGPLGLFRGEPLPGDLEAASGIIARYSDHTGLERLNVAVKMAGGESTAVAAVPADKESVELLRFVY